MQRKQQVGECWVCVIFFACVCVWVRQIRQLRLTIPSPRALSVCVGRFPRGVPGGAGMPPLGYVQRSGQRLKFFFWAVFAIFSGFCYF
jgi:hypothetical protein